MPHAPAHLLIGVDTGGTFTDLIAWDGQDFRTAKVPSTPPAFDRGVLQAIASILHPGEMADLVHGSTVATNALLERKGQPVAFVTTEGFADLLLIGRQNRPQLYALEPSRPARLVRDEHTFTLPERIDAQGQVLEALDPAAVDRLITRIKAQGLRHVAVCLLFSFVNPVHEKLVGDRCRAAGLSVTLSSELVPEFREYERACATAINASLAPAVESYLARIAAALPSSVQTFRIMHSGGGTLEVPDASRFAARLLLSGPAGGVLGASHVASAHGFDRIITYDMGGTSTDVAAAEHGKPPWTTSALIDHLPVPLPMFDIHTIGAGGGSIASLDAGGALQVGPQSAGADPGPACYGRGGTLATVTDANLALGRLVPDRFLGGHMALDAERAHAALGQLARQMNKSPLETAMGIVRIAESNMAAAIRHVTSRRGLDPRSLTLVCFGGAGPLHAAALAQALEIGQILVPPHAGLLSALGMIVAPPIVDVSLTVAQLATIDDHAITSVYQDLSQRSTLTIPISHTARVETFADCRFQGQSYELTVPVLERSQQAIEHAFRQAYAALYGQCPGNRTIQIVTLRLRRIGHAAQVPLPPITPRPSPPATTRLILADGSVANAPVTDRQSLLASGASPGPLLLADPDSTTFVPPGWIAHATPTGGVILERTAAASAEHPHYA